MTKAININDRGTRTLPKQLWQRRGVVGNGQLVAEDTDEGVLLRAGAAFLVELYSERRLRT